MGLVIYLDPSPVNKRRGKGYHLQHTCHPNLYFVTSSQSLFLASLRLVNKRNVLHLTWKITQAKEKMGIISYPRVYCLNPPLPVSNWHDCLVKTAQIIARFSLHLFNNFFMSLTCFSLFCDKHFLVRNDLHALGYFYICTGCKIDWFSMCSVAMKYVLYKNLSLLKESNLDF